jgi:bacillithiol synthase
LKEIPLARLKISPFLRDFIEGAEPVHHLFNNHTVDREFCAKRSQHGASRSRLQTLFSNGLRGTTISDAQQAHLNLVLNPQSVVVCGGQQLGMFGGPLYTLLKIGSVAAEAKHLSDRLGLPVLPVFWLEDVDHDAAEASDVWTTDDEGIAVKKRIWDGMDPRLPQYKRRSNHSRQA